MDNEFPKSLYRDGDEFVWDGRPTDRLVVASADEQKAAFSEGWVEAVDYPQSVKSEPGLLDKTAKDIAAAIVDLTLDQLEEYREAEVAGKSRKGVLALFEAAIEEKLKG